MQRLERAITVYEEWLAAGRPVTPQLLLESHPDLGEFLAAMLRDRDELDAVVAAADDQVLGDFRILDEIGRGGMGVVYRARQRSLERMVALKVLPGHVTLQPSAVARFRREATLAARLEHPNIVQVFAVGNEGDAHFFAMELVEGAPLDRLDPATGEPRSVRQCVELAAGVCDALAHAHDQGVLHRDVKPSNILVRTDGRAVLTDFGLARDVDAPGITRTGAFAGTPHYTAPEQAAGETVDGRADVWSLGATLYELLTGERPFAGASTAEVLDRIRRTDPVEPTRLQPDLSPDLAAIVMKALEKEPGRRYQTAGAFGADLRAFLEFRPVTARRATPWLRLRRWTRREPLRAALAAVLAVGVPALAGTLLYVWVNQPRIEAAVAAEAGRQREEAIATAWHSVLDGDRMEALRILEGIGDPDRDVTFSRVWLLGCIGKDAEARALLVPHADATATLLRDYLDRTALPSAANERSQGDALDCFFRARILLERATRAGAGTTDLLRRAAGLADAAIALAPSPRLTYLITKAAAAQLLDDDALIASAAMALERHFPDSLLAQRVRTSALSRRQPEAALAAIARIRSASAAPGFARNEAVAFEALGRLDEAVAANRRAIEENPDDAAAHANLGIVLRKQKDHAGSAAALQRSLQLRPDHPQTWNALGLTQRGNRDAAAARAAFAKAMELRPDYAAAAYNLGNLLMAEKDLEGAIAAFRTAVAADPGDVKGVANLGDALQRAGRQQEALTMHLRAAQLAPDDLVPNHNVAATALQLGLAELALPAARRASEVDKTGHNGPRVLAEALLAQQSVDATAALAAAREADARAKGRNLRARVVLAKALAASGDVAQARTMLEAVEQEPSFAGSSDRTFLIEELTRLRTRQ